MAKIMQNFELTMMPNLYASFYNHAAQQHSVCFRSQVPNRTYAHTHARTHARMHDSCKHARMYTIMHDPTTSRMHLITHVCPTVRNHA